MTRARTVWQCGTALVPVLGVCTASAQSSWVASADIAIVEHRVDAGFGSERFSGWTLGLEVARRFGRRVTVRVAGQGGQLQPAASGDLDRRIGEIEAGAQVAAGRWWALYGAVTRRAVASDAARQRWLFGRVGVEVHPAFTGENLRAIGRLGMIPAPRVNGLPTGSVSFDGAVGLEYERHGVMFAVVYDLERFGFPSVNGIRRAEQVSAFTLRGGLRWPRRQER